MGFGEFSVGPAYDAGSGIFLRRHGEVIAVGQDAFKADGYTECPIKPGDKIIMAKYAGLMYVGKDGNKYRMINDDDITGILDPDMELVDPHLIKGLK